MLGSGVDLRSECGADAFCSVFPRAARAVLGVLAGVRGRCSGPKLTSNFWDRRWARLGIHLGGGFLGVSCWGSETLHGDARSSRVETWSFPKAGALPNGGRRQRRGCGAGAMACEAPALHARDAAATAARSRGRRAIEPAARLAPRRGRAAARSEATHCKRRGPARGAEELHMAALRWAPSTRRIPLSLAAYEQPATTGTGRLLLCLPLLLAVHYWPLAADDWLLTTGRLLLAPNTGRSALPACYWPPTPRCLQLGRTLVTACYSPYCWPPTTDCLLPPMIGRLLPSDDCAAWYWPLMICRLPLAFPGRVVLLKHPP